jgi:hypothetical protein
MVDSSISVCHKVDLYNFWTPAKIVILICTVPPRFAQPDDRTQGIFTGILIVIKLVTNWRAGACPILLAVPTVPSYIIRTEGSTQVVITCFLLFVVFTR